MLGTTLKLGFDGSSVDRGLGGITGKFGRIGRQIGIGMARHVGASLTDVLGRIVMTLPDTLNWAGNMNDMATQTGMTVTELVLLEEKLRLSGAAAADTSRIISTLKENIYEAMNAEGPERDALHKLGFLASDFKGADPSQIFDTIGKRVAELGPKFEGLEGTMADLFGARMGYKLLRFFNDFEGSTKQAENNVGKLADAMGDGAAAKMDNLSDSLGRFETWKKSITTIALDRLFRAPGGDNLGNLIFDTFNPEKIRPLVEKFDSMLAENLEVVLSGDASIGDVFKNIGRMLGDGFKEAIDPLIGNLTNLLGRNLEVILSGDTGIGDKLEAFGRKFGEGLQETLFVGIGDRFENIKKKIGEGFKEKFEFSPSAIIKGMFPGKDKEKSVNDSEMKRQTSLLEDIRSNGKTARFA